MLLTENKMSDLVRSDVENGSIVKAKLYSDSDPPSRPVRHAPFHHQILGTKTNFPDLAPLINKTRVYTEAAGGSKLQVNGGQSDLEAFSG